MQASRVTSELGEGPAFGSCPFDPEEQQAIQKMLQSAPSVQAEQCFQQNTMTSKFASCVFLRNRYNTLESKIDLANELFL